MKLLSILSAVTLAVGLQAQTTTQYVLSLDNAAYAPLTESELITPEQPWDDVEEIFPIGFVFPIYGETVENLILTNVSELVATSNFGNPNVDIIAPVFTDPIDRGYEGETSLSDISYFTEGTEGNRICKVQWRNIGFYSDVEGFPNFSNYQLWLYEATGVIEVRFGENSSPSLNVMDNNGTLLVKNIVDDSVIELLQYTAGEPNDPSLISTDNFAIFEETGMLTAHPAEGQIYRFTPEQVESVAEVKEDLDWTIYPTASEQWVNVKLQGTTKAELIVRDLTGKEIKHIVLRETNTQLDISDLNAGIYMFTLLKDNLQETKRVVKR